MAEAQVLPNMPSALSNQQVRGLESTRKDKFVRNASNKNTNNRFSPKVPNTTRPIESANIPETLMNPKTVSVEEKRLEEQRHKDLMAKQRQAVKAQMKKYLEQPLPDTIGIEESEKLDRTREEIMKSYASQYNAAPEDGAIRSRIRKEVHGKALTMLAKDLRKNVTKQIVSKLPTRIAQALSDGSALEWEGVLLWFWTIVGALIWGARGVVTIFNPQSPKWLNLIAFDFKDPTTWLIDLPYGIIAILILACIFILINALLIFIGLILIALGIMSDYLYIPLGFTL